MPMASCFGAEYLEAEVLSDPTDHALAAIASILDQPEAHPEPEKAAVEEKPIPPELIEADGYHKVGPGPMAGDAAIRFVDEREREARRQFEQLKSEMSGRSAAANLVRKDGGEM